MIPEVTDAEKEYLIGMRRKFHSIPELNFEEFKTSEMIEKELSLFGYKHQNIAGTGKYIMIDTKKPGKTLMARFDMDGLPVTEENEVEYKSIHPGKMHACGHDAHIAIGLAIARYFSKNFEKLASGKLMVLFQPAEEGGAGAFRIVKEGLLKKEKVDAAFALHVWNHLQTGEIGAVPGTVLAGVDEFKVKIIGTSGHGAIPQHTIDPILTAGHIIVALQSIVSRNLDPMIPGVVTVATMHSGTAFNIIPPFAEMTGTIRSYSKESAKMLRTRFEEIVNGICNTFGAKAEIHYKSIDNPTINDAGLISLVRNTAIKLWGEACLSEENIRTMGGEDFSAYLDFIPGAYFFIGSKNGNKNCFHSHHHPKFNLDEDALSYGYLLMRESIINYMSQ